MQIIDRSLDLCTKESHFIFPSSKHDDQAINPKAITRAFGRLRDFLEIKDATPHDLHRTGATHMTGEKLGFSRFLVSQVLNHSGDAGGAAAVTATYDRNEYLSEKRGTLNA
ncbi:MAG: hypothetical protein HRU27_19630 [Rhizobiaceae bacterium]|nr:hypothetical protein [Hyphomicrobiales bacterium]NRB32804.1 hypothetical protein [Rhizobiaceae bacterium]